MKKLYLWTLFVLCSIALIVSLSLLFVLQNEFFSWTSIVMAFAFFNSLCALYALVPSKPFSTGKASILKGIFQRKGKLEKYQKVRFVLALVCLGIGIVHMVLGLLL